MNNGELKAQVYVQLSNMGFRVEMNHRVNLGLSLRGWKVLVIDLVIKDLNGKICCIIYIGRKKTRKYSKYQFLNKPLFMVDTDKWESQVGELIKSLTKLLYK